MNPALFGPKKPGKILRIGRGDAVYAAFVPNPLPPTLDWSPVTVSLLSKADLALGRLAGIGKNLPNPHLLMGSFKRREAVLSSRIEGTRASMSDLLLFEAAPEVEPAVSDVREVSNYVRALEHGLARRSSLPMSLRLMKEMHALLMEGVDGTGGAVTPGEFRRSQNWIGPPGCTLSTATYVPPPPDEMIAALGVFEAYLHAKSDLPTLVRLAIIHYQFEAIHPFLDGNGRIGRLLITLLLTIEGVLPGPLLYLSAYFEKSRNEYYRGLLRVSLEGAWIEWVEYFLRGVAEQAGDAVARAERLVRVRDEFRERLVRSKASATALRLVDELFAHPALSVAQAARALGVTPRSGQSTVDKLVAAGILRESTGRKRNRAYVADEILRAVE
jgi:Fic family protein